MAPTTPLKKCPDSVCQVSRTSKTIRRKERRRLRLQKRFKELFGDESLSSSGGKFGSATCEDAPYDPLEGISRRIPIRKNAVPPPYKPTPKRNGVPPPYIPTPKRKASRSSSKGQEEEADSYDPVKEIGQSNLVLFPYNPTPKSKLLQVDLYDRVDEAMAKMFEHCQVDPYDRVEAEMAKMFEHL